MIAILRLYNHRPVRPTIDFFTAWTFCSFFRCLQKPLDELEKLVSAVREKREADRRKPRVEVGNDSPAPTQMVVSSTTISSPAVVITLRERKRQIPSRSSLSSVIVSSLSIGEISSTSDQHGEHNNNNNNNSDVEWKDIGQGWSRRCARVVHSEQPPTSPPSSSTTKAKRFSKQVSAKINEWLI